MSQSVDFMVILSNCRHIAEKMNMNKVFFTIYSEKFCLSHPIFFICHTYKIGIKSEYRQHTVKNITNIGIVSSFTFIMKIKWLYFKHFLIEKGKMLKTVFADRYFKPLLFRQHSPWQTLKDIHMYITKHWDSVALLFKFVTTLSEVVSTGRGRARCV